MSATVFSQAQVIEKVSIVILLTECGLSIREMNSDRTCFIVAKQDGRIIGCIGLEACGKTGLIHSLAVKRDFRSTGLGRQLYEKMSEQARAEGMEEFYVLTRAAEGLFARWGFAKTDRDQVPEEISNTSDFKNDIFSTYACMKKKLEQKAPTVKLSPGVDVQAAVSTILQGMVIPAAAQKPEITADQKDKPQEIAAVAEDPVADVAPVDPAVASPQQTIIPAAETPHPAAAPEVIQPQQTALPAAESLQPAAPLAFAAAPQTEPPTTLVSALPSTLAFSPEPLTKESAPVEVPAAVPVPDPAPVPASKPVSVSEPAPDTASSPVPVPDPAPEPAASSAPAPASVPAAAPSYLNVQHYPADRLPLIGDLVGARTWGVALSNAMLVYFELAPETQLEAHTHEHEHITMVIEGQLFFGIGGKIISVRTGEVIAIPANTPHGIYTAEHPARAVEAVAPVPDEYRE